MYSHIIWDWNGTLLDDRDLCNETVNRLLESRGCAPLSRERYYEVFGFPVENYYAAAGFDFSKDPYPVLAQEFMDMYIPASLSCGLTPGARCALDYFRASGRAQIILTASDTDTLGRQMEKLGIADRFDAVLGQDNIYARGKTEIAAEWIRNSGLDPKELLMIGDTLHDAEIAGVLGCDCVLIARGHHDEKRLAAAGCPVYTSLFALLRELTGGMPEGCVFDMDGTVLDTVMDIAGAVNATRAHYGEPPCTREEVVEAICHGVRNLLKTLIRGAAEDETFLDEVVAFYRGCYSSHLTDRTVPYAGIPELLSHLEATGIPASIQSNKSHHLVLRIAGTFFPDRFVHVSGLRDGCAPKPSPEGALTAAKDMKVMPERCCYIGDSDVDIKTGMNAGMLPLGVSWGYRSREVLFEAGAQLVFDTVAELSAFLGDESRL
ncbi:MAG: HAD family hydrolase [Clostridia bacterium]|nr:HAD family hydrolase [Clostridia bacterium]